MITERSSQVAGNVGLYYVCYQLAKRGWNVMPTSRIAKGVDIIIIYNHDASKGHTIQVKSLTKKDAAVPLGRSLDSLQMNDYLIICRSVYTAQPEIFIAKPAEITYKILKKRIDEKGKPSYGLAAANMNDLLEGGEIIEEIGV